MKIATFNVSGVNGRLPVLLRRLEETSPDVVCLQELKSETFPQSAFRAAGYEGVLSRRGRGRLRTPGLVSWRPLTRYAIKRVPPAVFAI